VQTLDSPKTVVYLLVDFCELHMGPVYGLRDTFYDCFVTPVSEQARKDCMLVINVTSCPQPFSIRGLAVSWTIFLHSSLPPVALIALSVDNPVQFNIFRPVYF